MQLNREKLRLQLNRYVPITAWLPAYPRELLRTDIISGVTVWGVMVPVAMAYAQMAGLRPRPGSTPPLRRCSGC
jgi:MFS superfamily sulfate permease-like transporter